MSVQASMAAMVAASTPKAAFGVGGSCSPRMPSQDPMYPGSGSQCPPGNVVPGCARPGRVCDVGKMGATTIVQGGQVFQLLIVPTGVAYFDIEGVRCTVTDLGNSDLNHRVLFTAVRVGIDGREAYDDTNPTAPTAAGDTIAGQWSDDWIDPDRYAIPVGWGKSSNVANEIPLRITGIALGLPPTTLVAVSVTCVGNPTTKGPDA